jgi:hypothetical protein
MFPLLGCCLFVLLDSLRA